MITGATRLAAVIGSPIRHSLSPTILNAAFAATGADWAFVALELIGFGASFAITQTIAAIGFPVFILLYIPMRTFLMPRFFTPSELNILDAPTASPFTIESVGGNHGQAAEASSNELLEEAERGESEGVLRQRRGSAVGSSSRRGMSFRSREEGGGGALGKE